jgi:hypothetical protein
MLFLITDIDTGTCTIGYPGFTDIKVLAVHPESRDLFPGVETDRRSSRKPTLSRVDVEFKLVVCGVNRLLETTHRGLEFLCLRIDRCYRFGSLLRFSRLAGIRAGRDQKKDYRPVNDAKQACCFHGLS